MESFQNLKRVEVTNKRNFKSLNLSLTKTNEFALYTDYRKLNLDAENSTVCIKARELAKE